MARRLLPTEKPWVHKTAAAFGALWALLEAGWLLHCWLNARRPGFLWAVRPQWGLVHGAAGGTLALSLLGGLWVAGSLAAGVLLAVGALRPLHWLHVPFLLFATHSAFQSAGLVVKTAVAAGSRRWVGLPTALVLFLLLAFSTLGLLFAAHSFLLLHERRVREREPAAPRPSVQLVAAPALPPVAELPTVPRHAHRHAHPQIV
ncbi:hypothetical protein M3Y99_00644900 [Aphelenchoides fujianensis]|nr:hypothetical protein M3Y99_00644900 [Aphelenchoides fujianensis]